jgi:hypothetical protein
MVTCAWCGTNYNQFQSNCQNCGATLPLPEAVQEAENRGLTAGPGPAPPPAPRSVPRNYLSRQLLTDGGAIAGGVLALIGAIFTLVGGVLTVLVITAFVGVPFLLLGLVMGAVGVGVLYWRYKLVRTRMEVLQSGSAAEGEVAAVFENRSVEVNGRHPWVVEYIFRAPTGQVAGQASTLSRLPSHLQPGANVHVLYNTQRPTENVLYPPLM